MPVRQYRRTELTDGTSDSLDGIDGSILNEGDIAQVYLSGTEQLYFYRLDSDSGATESSPDIIAPNDSPGSKRFILQNIITSNLGRETVTVYDTTTADSTSDLEIISIGIPLDNLAVGRLYHIDTIAKNTTSEVRYYSTLTFVVLRDSGNAYVEEGVITQLDSKTMRFGWWDDGKDIEFLVECDEDGNDLSIKLRNTTVDTTYQVNVTVRM